MDARAYLVERSVLVDRELDAVLPAAGAPPASLHGAMRHLVFPGGKRLRPGLALAAAEAVGSPPDVALPIATAVELVHTWSLIHDDLPCMDDDVERRGRPTVHVAYDEATALLAGDALLALAFEVALSRGAAPAALRLEATRELATAAGAVGLVGGQVDDLFCARSGGDAAFVESIHARKTAALITAAIVGGATLAGAAEPDRERLRRFGLGVGVAFQIADDLLDVGEDACSLVGAVGEEAARARGEVLLDSALAEVAAYGAGAEPLRALALFALRRKE
ncbi:MAG: polyprenyl synthetase family protein [Deltaproteobacteria bacterium]|nr:polyprenyl synthetase family protein [Deltaproteobacteria bacterium]MBW2361392.1 polyprenyl synthetase family protein [Deltaproteobacteria bacterium]